MSSRQGLLQEEAARRERLMQARASLAAEQHTNAERVSRQDVVKERLLGLQVSI